LENCANAVTNYVTQANQSLAGTRNGLLASATSQSGENSIIVSDFQSDQRLYSSSSLSCQQVASASQTTLPQRPTFADTLGPVGTWTRWLLDTEQMPMVIIVGLVGFSLLGATVSRAVRLGPDKPNALLTVDDLLVVIAGGTTAALVVFLAAYGGLALLGSSGGDPNPYIVFVTCLIGAVYSEDVWAWARSNVLKSATRDRQSRTPQSGVGSETAAHAKPKRGAQAPSGATSS
jgi:hypothetical protein